MKQPVMSVFIMTHLVPSTGSDHITSATLHLLHSRNQQPWLVAITNLTSLEITGATNVLLTSHNLDF